ncbi:MAG: hypothetical protein LUD56_04435, partial [Enterocloster citroniae]|nr:hypothetical protein [Enterocloster citroniae]
MESRREERGMQGEAENKQNKKPAALAFGAVIFLLLGMIYIAINTGSLNVTMGELYRGLFVEYDQNVA